MRNEPEEIEEWLPHFLVDIVLDPKQGTGNTGLLALPASLGDLCAVLIRSNIGLCFSNQLHSHCSLAGFPQTGCLVPLRCVLFFVFVPPGIFKSH